MKSCRELLSVKAAIATFALICFGLPWYWMDQLRMQNNPVRIFQRYQSELQVYVHQIMDGSGAQTEQIRRYAVPQFLASHGARYVSTQGDCIVISFGFMPTDPVPELWYNPKGFDPFPPELEKLTRGSYFHWEQLAPDWGACYWDQ